MRVLPSKVRTPRRGNANDTANRRNAENAENGRELDRDMSSRGMRVVDASVTFEDYDLRSPLVITGGSIEEATEAQVSVTVADDSGRTATGRGTVFLSAIWAWPQSKHGFVERVDAMQ